MHSSKSNDPLHGVTLKAVLEVLVEKFGWKGLSKKIEVRCFYNDPSISSSLKFLRKTSWARAEVEKLYIEVQNAAPKKSVPKDVWKK